MPQLAIDKRMICVTGLPRAGSTLLCQLLGHHPDIYSTGHSSPLCPTIMGLRRHLSESDFLLAQLDPDLDLVHQRLINACRGFTNGWFVETDKPWVVDKNRGWLHHLETACVLDPDCRMLVCVRELGQIYGSIEAQHQKTLMLDFPDHLAGLSRAERAKKLFAEDGVVGSPIHAIESMQDLPDTLQKQHLYYVVFEHLVSDPVAVMQGIYRWLDLPEALFEPDRLTVKPHESDSYYRFKYPHNTYPRIQPPATHAVPDRFQAVLSQRFGWYYATFYPGHS